MIVTEIRPVTKKRSQVYVEGQPAFVLYNGELSRYHIREGEEIPLSIWEEITGELLIKRSRKRALNLLLKGDRTRSCRNCRQTAIPWRSRNRQWNMQNPSDTSTTAGMRRTT